MLIWYANGDKLANFLLFSQSQQANLDAGRFETLFFYPRSVFLVYYASPLTSLATMFGLLWGAWHIREHRYRALTTYIVVVIVLLTLVPQKEHRFTYTMLPAMVALTSAALWSLIARFLERCRVNQWSYRFVIAIILLFAINEIRFTVERFSFFNAAQEATLACPTNDVALAYDFLLETSAALEKRPYLLNTWHRLNQFGLVAMHMDETPWRVLPSGYRLADGGLAVEPTEENLSQFRDESATTTTGGGLQCLNRSKRCECLSRSKRLFVSP